MHAHAEQNLRSWLTLSSLQEIRDTTTPSPARWLWGEAFDALDFLQSLKDVDLRLS